ncbi:TITAN-like protein isoform X1 [Papaver somniferum]|uniref:TITAN-like protein isoform X1 n=1 Tax=Papaver somniferum TaxID=3469 RepID=UPI000E6F6E42|nr:TITAN-like protein isoform X1 [Papaver somniferum]
MEEKKKKQKQNHNMEFEYCKVCKLNHNLGPKHKYLPNHIKSLSSFLSRFNNKLSDVRFFIKNPTVIRLEHASRNRLWCVFCDSDIHELDSLFACSNAINHLASPEHLKNLKDFMWKNGGGMDRVDSFRVSESDLSKWKKICRVLENSDPLANGEACRPSLGPSKDIHNQLISDTKNNLEIYSFNSSNSNGFVPLQSFTNERQQEFPREVHGIAAVGSFLCDTFLPAAGGHSYSYAHGMHGMGETITCPQDYADKQNGFLASSGTSSVDCSPSNKAVYQVGRLCNGGSSKQASQNSTQSLPLLPQVSKDNVHAGAPPPWFDTVEEIQLHHITAGVSENGLAPSSRKSVKSQKLNPKRVGAAWAERRKLELEMEKRGEIVNNFDADWLPNFGRVWQSGSRNESRKEFQMEKQKLPEVDSGPDVPIVIQPYVSKRMRKDIAEDKDAVET